MPPLPTRTPQTGAVDAGIQKYFCVRPVHGDAVESHREGDPVYVCESRTRSTPVKGRG